MARIPNEANMFSLHRVFGSSLSQRKKWFSLSSRLVGRKVSQFLKGKFFECFPNEISRVRVADLWRENGEHVPCEWFGVQNSEEAFAITLFGLCGGLVKLCSTADDGFLSSDVFVSLVDKINNLDVGESRAIDGTANMAIDGTPKSQRIAILEKDLQFYREKVRQTKNSIANTLETPPTTPLPSTSRKMDTLILSNINDSSLGPISKKREMRTVSNLALEDIDDAFHSSYGRLGAILGYGFIYGKEEHQQAVKSAISEAIEIVAESKGLESAAELAFTPDVKQKQEAAMRVPDWVQLYVKLETKLPDDGWQTVLNFLNLGKSGVSFRL